jgi:hypothetical protein
MNSSVLTLIVPSKRKKNIIANMCSNINRRKKDGEENGTDRQ